MSRSERGLNSPNAGRCFPNSERCSGPPVSAGPRRSVPGTGHSARVGTCGLHGSLSTARSRRGLGARGEALHGPGGGRGCRDRCEQTHQALDCGNQPLQVGTGRCGGSENAADAFRRQPSSHYDHAFVRRTHSDCGGPGAPAVRVRAAHERMVVVGGGLSAEGISGVLGPPATASAYLERLVATVESLVGLLTAVPAAAAPARAMQRLATCSKPSSAPCG